MKSLTDSYVLPNGAKIPCVGFGTWQAPDGSVAVSAVKAAIGAGYRHIDTAAIYGNEASVGRAVKESGVARSDLFITTKLWNEDHGYERTLRAFEASLQKLGLDYIDLYLVHWPNPISFRGKWQEANAGTWKAFEELYRAGRIRAIGVSNFRQRHLDELAKTADVAPMVNQIRLCPGGTQDELAEYCRERGVLLEAYSPLGMGKALASPEVMALAGKYAKSAAQICIRWSLQRGYLPLPKSVTPSRIRENADVFDFELGEADAARLAGLAGGAGEAFDPDKTPF
ncbi:MAG: aldo/keto reductase [Clostridiales bacterium]|jgi:diketogulonate reductase-like aldo/keto reductase|nr:aldo/keto reductase [Clostridiales bacterium]